MKYPNIKVRSNTEYPIWLTSDLLSYGMRDRGPPATDQLTYNKNYTLLNNQK
jgi:hypothetical protein